MPCCPAALQKLLMPSCTVSKWLTLGLPGCGGGNWSVAEKKKLAAEKTNGFWI